MSNPFLNRLLGTACTVLLLTNLSGRQAKAQVISFERYTLSNGLKVLLHQDTTTPIVAVTVSYKVGSKTKTLNGRVLLISSSISFLREAKILVAVST